MTATTYDVVIDFGDDLQATFDRVVTHLAQQKRRSKVSSEEAAGSGMCRYRTGTLSCAVGCLIPDELYRVWLDDTDASAVDHWFDEGVFTATHNRIPSLLSSLQSAHDRHVTPNGLRVDLHDIAENYALDPHLIAQIKEWQ